MIKYIIKGRLGNQMFIYAFAKAIYNKNRIPYCFSHLDKLNYFKLTLQDRFLNIFKKLYFAVFINPKNNTTLLNLDSCWNIHQNLNLNKDTNYIISGYFQSEIYFNHIMNDVKNYFDIRNKFKLKKINLNIPDEYTAIHIRRGDYTNVYKSEQIGGPDLTLPISYYHDALNYLKPTGLIFILTDDPTFVKENLHVSDIRISDQNEITDFQILLNARNCIISNSTFSWWAAWLNKQTDKCIIAPKYFLGRKIKKEFPVNIIPDNWIQI